MVPVKGLLQEPKNQFLDLIRASATKPYGRVLVPGKGLYQLPSRILFKTTLKDPYKETGAVKYKRVPLKQLTQLLSIYCLRLLDVKLAPASRAAVALQPVESKTVINQIFNVQLIISNNHFTDPLIDSSVTY